MEDFTATHIETPNIEESVLSHLDTLDSQFDTLFSHLDTDAKEEERQTRQTLFLARAHYLTNRFEFGSVLTRYWFWAQMPDKKTQSQGQTFKGLCELLGIDERTARNIRKDYAEAVKLPPFLRLAALRAGFDISEFRYRGLLAELMNGDHHELTDPALRSQRADRVFNHALSLWRSRTGKNAEQLGDYERLLAFTYNLFNKKTAGEMRLAMKKVTDAIAYDRNDSYKIAKPKKQRETADNEREAA